MKTFLFYDTETSGLNPAFDQILTFAAIRTDMSLNEMERYMIVVRLRPDIVPSPAAFLTHGLTQKDLQEGCSEYEAALTIHKIVNTPGTLSLGYNTLGFDDEFLRFLFYRNLLDPYTHQYANGCGRLDILPVTVLYRLFKPDIVEWPKIDGRPSLKLEHISRQNHFEISGKAHEAMSDVEAVIALSKKFHQVRDSWDYALDFFNKTRDEVRIAGIEKALEVGGRKFRLCLMASTAFGPDSNYLAPVIELGPSRPYKNQTLWLRLDVEDILGIREGLDIESLFVIRKRSGDGLIVLPVLDRFREKLATGKQALARENIGILRRNDERFIRMVEYHCNYKYPYVPEMDMDAALYQEGFFSSEEKKQIGFFHRLVSKKQFDAVDRIQNKRVRQLANRIVYRNFPGSFGGEEENRDVCLLEKLRSDKPDDRIIGFRNDEKLNVKKALQELDKIKTGDRTLSVTDREILEWLEEYLTRL